MSRPSRFVESVDLRRLGGSTRGNNFLRNRFDGRRVPPGEKQIGPVRCKRACDSAPDRASGSVNHSNLILEQHHFFPFNVVIRQTDLYPRWARKWMATEHQVVANKSRADPD